MLPSPKMMKESRQVLRRRKCYKYLKGIKKWLCFPWSWSLIKLLRQQAAPEVINAFTGDLAETLSSLYYLKKWWRRYMKLGVGWADDKNDSYGELKEITKHISQRANIRHKNARSLLEQKYSNLVAHRNEIKRLPLMVLIIGYVAWELPTLNFLHFQNNSWSWNSASKYLLKNKMKTMWWSSE